MEIEKARLIMPRMIWPTRLQRRLSHAKEDNQREKIEEDERTRQINKLVDLLSKSGLLKEDTRREGAASVWMTKRRAMGRRASTLRVHVRTGEKMRMFCASSLGKEWFGGGRRDGLHSRLAGGTLWKVHPHLNRGGFEVS